MQAELEQGEILSGDYRIVRKLGQGEAGATYLAADPEGGKYFVKVLAPHLWSDPEQILRFEKESRAASLLASPYIARVLGTGRTAKGAPFLVMEALQGDTLTGLLARYGKLEERTGISLLQQVCEGLAGAHDAGIIHRDINPDNIFIEAGQGGIRVKLLGFGSARVPTSEGKATLSGLALGVPEYMAPEVGMGRPASVASDIYALGCVAYELFCGRPPFTAKGLVEILMAHAEQRPTPPRQLRPDLSPEVEHAILRALEKDPGRRFSSAREFARHLSPSHAAAPQIVPVGAALTSTLHDTGFTYAPYLPDTYQPPPGLKATMIGNTVQPLKPASIRPAEVGWRPVPQPEREVMVEKRRRSPLLQPLGLLRLERQLSGSALLGRGPRGRWRRGPLSCLPLPLALPPE